MACKQEAHLPALVPTRPEGTQEATQKAEARQQPKRLRPPKAREEGPRVGVGFHPRPRRRKRPAEMADHSGRVHQGMPGPEGRKEHRGGGRQGRADPAIHGAGGAEHIRSDNGPEFIARAIRCWLERSEAKTLYVEPGAPWGNGYAEAFQSRLRDELLNAKELRDVRETAALAQQWRRHHNRERPHSVPGYLTPAESTEARVPPGLGSLALPEHARPKQQNSLIAVGT